MNRRAFLRSSLPAALPVFAAGCCRRDDDTDDIEVVDQRYAFGTGVSITVAGLAADEAETLLDGAAAEMERLESIFTLFEPDSPLRRLNRDGRLENPPAELVRVLQICAEVNRITDGAFDPTVQPLWELYENYFALRPGRRVGPSQESIAAARARIGWGSVVVTPERIVFAKEGMALTLNGIAPGYTADHITRWLADRGAAHALADIGEFRALGTRPDGSAWKIGIKAGDEVVDEAGLVDNGLATSSGSGTVFDREGEFHHLFNPQRNQFSDAARTISVEAPSAAFADALATAGGVMEFAQLQRVAAKLASVRVREFAHQADSRRRRHVPHSGR